MRIDTTSSAATASSSDISSADNSDNPNVKQPASNSVTRILNGVLGTIPGTARSSGGATAQVEDNDAVLLGDTDIISEGTYVLSTESVEPDGLHTAYASGGVWGATLFSNGFTNYMSSGESNLTENSKAELSRLQEIAQPQLQHPKDLAQSVQYVQDLKGGKTIQDLIGTDPTAQQQGDMQDALELLGVSNRQIAAYTASAYRLGADSYFNDPSGETSTGLSDSAYKKPLDVLRDAGKIRAAIDAGGEDTIVDYRSGNEYPASDLPGQLSTEGMIAAVEQGVYDSGSTSGGSSPELAAHDVVFGGRDESWSFAMFPDRDPFSIAYSVDKGQSLLETTKVAAEVPASALEDSVTLQPTDPMNVALTAMTMGSSATDVFTALTAQGVDGLTARDAITEAYDSMGISDAKLGQLAENAQDDIADIGGADNLMAYFNDPATAGQHADLDELLAGLEARYEFDDYAQMPDNINSLPTFGFLDAQDAVADVLGADTVAKLPIGLVEAQPGATPDAAPTESFIPTDNMPNGYAPDGELRRNLLSNGTNQTPIATTNTTASNQTAAANNTTASNQTATANNTTQFNATAIANHNASGVDAGAVNGTLHLPPVQNVTVAPDFLNSTTLSAPFTGTPPQTYTVDDVNNLITSAEVITSGINGTVTAQMLAGLNGTSPVNQEAVVDQALEDKGVVATREQITEGLTAAMLSPAYQQWLKQQPAGSDQNALATLQLFNQTAAIQVDAHNQLNATLGPTAVHQLRGAFATNAPTAALQNIDPQDKAASGLATAQIAIGGMRYTGSMLGKLTKLQALKDGMTSGKLREAYEAFADIVEALGVAHADANTPGEAYGIELQHEIASRNLDDSQASYLQYLGDMMSERGWFKKLDTGLTAASTVLAAASFGVRAARLSGMTDLVSQASTGISLVADMMSIAEPATKLYGKLPENWRKAIGGVAAYLGTPATSLMAKAGIDGASSIPGVQFLGSVLKNGGDTGNLLYAASVFGSLRNFATEGFNYRDTYNTIRSVVDASSFALWAANKLGAVSDLRMNQIRAGTTALSALLAFVAAGNP